VEVNPGNYITRVIGQGVRAMLAIAMAGVVLANCSSSYGTTRKGHPSRLDFEAVNSFVSVLRTRREIVPVADAAYDVDFPRTVSDVIVFDFVNHRHFGFWSGANSKALVWHQCASSVFRIVRYVLEDLFFCIRLWPDNNFWFGDKNIDSWRSPPVFGINGDRDSKVFVAEWDFQPRDWHSLKCCELGMSLELLRREGCTYGSTESRFSRQIWTLLTPELNVPGSQRQLSQIIGSLGFAHIEAQADQGQYFNPESGVDEYAFHIPKKPFKVIGFLLLTLVFYAFGRAHITTAREYAGRKAATMVSVGVILIVLAFVFACCFSKVIT
jgi:hypothetical protein